MDRTESSCELIRDWILDGLKRASVDEVKDYIRYRLRYDDSEGLKHHRRFDMSGYGPTCAIDNTAILNEFNDLGIYDYTHFLYLDFYKGCGSLYYSKLGDHGCSENQYGGEGTTEIIYQVFKLTILSGDHTRRRY